jgi:hypothetical protein
MNWARAPPMTARMRTIASPAIDQVKVDGWIPTTSGPRMMKELLSRRVEIVPSVDVDVV